MLHTARYIDRYQHSLRRGKLSRSMWGLLKLASIIVNFLHPKDEVRFHNALLSWLFYLLYWITLHYYNR